jgi:putative ABC transport system permease protein
MTSGDVEGVQVDVGLVSGNYFDLLGVRSAAGRTFLPEEDRAPRTHPVTVISHALWQRRYGGDPGIIGSTVDLNGHRFTVVGVAAEGFRGVSPAEMEPDLWVPIMMQPVVLPTGGDMLHRLPGERQVWLQALARLKPGVGVEAARANMTELAERLAAAFPENTEGNSVALTEHYQYHPFVRDRLVTLMRLLMAVTGVVLLIACVNIAILLLARISTRQKELAVSRAVGAGRGRLVRGLLTESLVLALAGGAAGLAIAAWSAGVAAAMIPISFNVEFRPDWTVVGFTLLLCAATALLFGLAPAWLASRPDIIATLRGSEGRGGRSALRSGLVVAQVALAIVLVSGAGLFVRSFSAAQSVELGFQTENRLVVPVNLRDGRYSDVQGRAFVRGVLERLSRVPGVLAATTTLNVPLDRTVWSGSFEAEGVEPPPSGNFESGFNAVGPGYLRAMGIPLLAGRGITERDDESALPVAVVNETVARLVWPNQDPIGKIIERGPYRFTVIGVARDATYYELGEASEPQIYFSVLQVFRPRINFVVRTAGEPASFARPISSGIRGLDPDLAIYNIRTLEQEFANSVGQYRVIATLVSLFALLALILASVGLYGVLSYLVLQRTREIGIRVALGAHPGRVAGGFLTRGLRLALAGIALGTVVAWGGSRAVSSLLFGISPHDPVTFAMVPAVLVAVAGIASFLPARRASRVDPMIALRHE